MTNIYYVIRNFKDKDTGAFYLVGDRFHKSKVTAKRLKELEDKGFIELKKSKK